MNHICNIFVIVLHFWLLNNFILRKIPSYVMFISNKKKIPIMFLRFYVRFLRCQYSSKNSKIYCTGSRLIFFKNDKAFLYHKICRGRSKITLVEVLKKNMIIKRVTERMTSVRIE